MGARDLGAGKRAGPHRVLIGLFEQNVSGVSARRITPASRNISSSITRGATSFRPMKRTATRRW